MGSSCFKASSSNDPEDQVDDNAVQWYFTPWGGPRIDGNRRSIGESSKAGGSRDSPTVGDDEDQSSGVTDIRTAETVPRISEELWSLYRSLPREKPRIQGLAFKVDSPELMQMYLRKLVEPEIPKDPQRSNRDTPIIYPAQFAQRVHYITNGELPDTFTLKKRVQEKLSSERNGIHLNIMAVNVINAGLDIYMKRLLEARYANFAPGRMILPLKKVEHRRIAIWLNPSLITVLEKMPRYDAMPRFTPEWKTVPEHRVCLVDTSKKWLRFAENFFERLRCRVLPADSANEVLQWMGLIDDLPCADQIGKLHMICVEYHMAERNGLEVLLKMKKSEKWKNTPFIMASSERNDPPSLIDKCLEEGADMFVAKPMLDHSDDIEELEYWMRRILYQ